MLADMTTIRVCTNAQRSGARALLAAQLEEHGIPTGRLDAALDGALADPSRAIVLLAEEGEIPVGVAYVSFTWTLEHGGKSAWLEELYVEPDERGRGVGSAMLDELLRKTAEAGCAALDLEVESEHSRAEHLYARAGFKPHTRSRWVRAL